MWDKLTVGPGSSNWSLARSCAK